MKSMFMKFGDFSKDIYDDPYYRYENFEIIKNKLALGTGAFGEYFSPNTEKMKSFLL
jgi:hypothetical protein